MYFVVFGCLCFVSTREAHREKLGQKARKCVFFKRGDICTNNFVSFVTTTFLLFLLDKNNGKRKKKKRIKIHVSMKERVVSKIVKK